MGGVQRNWDKAANYAKKGKTVGGVHAMTPDERQAMFHDLGRTSRNEDERVARIAALKARRNQP